VSALLILSRFTFSRALKHEALLAYTYPYGGNPFSPSNLETTDGKPFSKDSYENPLSCGVCHDQQLSQWLPSLHARSADELIYEGVEAIAIADNSPEFVRWCNGCHTPVALAEGRISPGIPAGNHMIEGVSCAFCHTVSAVGTPLENASLVSSPDLSRNTAFWGPGSATFRAGVLLTRINPTPHRQSYLKDFHQSSEFCGSCHRETNPFRGGFVLQDTFQEWKESPYAKEGQGFASCQDCHMSDGLVRFEATPGQKVVWGKRYDHVSSHRFLGANTVIPALYGDREQLHWNEKMLRSCAQVTLEVPDAIEAGGSLKIRVSVTNSGAGHHLPTGIELRQMWLELSVVDSNEQSIQRFGEVDALGNLLGDPWLFCLRIGDAQGAEIHDHKIWLAEKVLEDSRIPAKSTVTREYRVDLPEIPGRFRVEATLRYRNLPQSLMNVFYRGVHTFSVPITDLAGSLKWVETTPATVGGREGDPARPPPPATAGISNGVERVDSATAAGASTGVERVDLDVSILDLCIKDGSVFVATDRGLARFPSDPVPDDASPLSHRIGSRHVTFWDEASGVFDSLVTKIAAGDGGLFLLSGGRLQHFDGQSSFENIESPLDGSLVSLGVHGADLYAGGVSGIIRVAAGIPHHAELIDTGIPTSEVSWIASRKSLVMFGTWLGIGWRTDDSFGFVRRDLSDEARAPTSMAFDGSGRAYAGTQSGLLQSPEWMDFETRFADREQTGSIGTDRDSGAVVNTLETSLSTRGWSVVGPPVNGPVLALDARGQTVAVATSHGLWMRREGQWWFQPVGSGPIAAVALTDRDVWVAVHGRVVGVPITGAPVPLPEL